MNGFVLRHDVEVLDRGSRHRVQLLKHDRLEVGGDVTDLWELPVKRRVTMKFFRAHPSRMFAFISELFAIPFFRFEYLTIDILHTLDLGVTQRVAGTALQRLLACKRALHNEATKHGFQTGLRHFNVQLRQYYNRANRERRLEGRSGSLTQIQMLTMRMLGFHKSLSATKCDLKCKGAEMRHAFPFAADLVEKNKHHLKHGVALAKACKELLQCYKLWQSHGRALDERLVTASIRHMVTLGSCMSAARIPHIPKCHMAVHLARQGHWAGNCEFFSTYRDEAYNRDIAQICRVAHVRDVGARILSRMWLREQGNDQ